MGSTRKRPAGSADPTAKVVNLGAYRVRRERNGRPLFGAGRLRAGRPRQTLSAGEVAHRERMLRHLTGQA